MQSARNEKMRIKSNMNMASLLGTGVSARAALTPAASATVPFSSLLAECIPTPGLSRQ